MLPLCLRACYGTGSACERMVGRRAGARRPQVLAPPLLPRPAAGAPAPASLRGSERFAFDPFVNHSSHLRPHPHNHNKYGEMIRIAAQVLTEAMRLNGSATAKLTHSRSTSSYGEHDRAESAIWGRYRG